MRRSCEWFSDRAITCWRAQAGRSMLLLVPQGSDEPQTALLVARWTEGNFTPPRSFSNHKPVIVRLASDSVATSEQFARRVTKELSRKSGFPLDIDYDDYPSDIFKNGVEATLAANAYPIIIIERFHAFASIGDTGMGSVLATMRDLEHTSQLTTIALSPVGYDVIRESMDAQKPFLTSVYGDNHDQAVMSPLSRDDFVQAAISRGISSQEAHRLYAKGGGPDVIFKTILDVAGRDDLSLVSICAERAGSTIDSFLRRSFSQAGATLDEILAKLALGRLSAHQAHFLQASPFAPFICGRTRDARVICSSPIIARRILARGAPHWKAYEDCLGAYIAGDFIAAGRITDLLTTDESLRLSTFRDLVRLKAAATPEPDRGLLGIDWAQIMAATRSLKPSLEHLLPSHRKWVKQLSDWAEMVCNISKGRLQLDMLTQRASETSLRDCLFFMIKSHVLAARSFAEPSRVISQLVNIPEAILQALAVAYCQLNYINAPAELPKADYGSYFNPHETFLFPQPGSKMALTSLMVIVPAVLCARHGTLAGGFADSARIKSLQQKLIDRVRNPASHTIATFESRDAILLKEVCEEWLDAWASLEGYDSSLSISGLLDSPKAEEISAILFEIETCEDRSSVEAVH